MLAHRIITTESWESYLCGDAKEYGSGTTGLWVMLFIYSKVPEVRHGFMRS